MNDRYLKAKEICEEWRISLPTLYRHQRTGLIPKGERVGLRAVRWRRSVIESAFAAMNAAA